MKKLAIIAAICLLGFSSEKTYKISFTQQEIEQTWVDLQTIKEIADRSNLPHQQVLFIDSAILRLQTRIGVQYQQQQKDTTGKAIKK